MVAVVKIIALSRKYLVVCALSFLIIATAHGQILNGGFESGALSPWTAVGTATIQGSFSGQAPFEGSFQAALTTPPIPGTVFTSSLESFLELSSGTLATLNSGGFNGGGSAVKQSFTVTAGTIVQFAWDFFPNGSTASSGQNDSAFFALHLAGVPSSSFTLLDQTSNHPTGTPSGYSVFSTAPLAAGTYLLGFGVYDNTAFSNAQNPALLVDRVVPEPTTSALLIAGGLVGAVGRRRARRA